MLTELKMIVDLIRDAVSGFKDFRSKKARSDAIYELFCIYFVLLDVETEGREFLQAVGRNPRITLEQATQEARASILSEWSNVLRRQGSRLYSLSGRILGQDALAVFDPRLKTRLETIVSSKLKRVRTLHGTGAALVMYLMFADPRDQNWGCDVILSMYPSETRATIDLEAARRELEALSKALEKFRSICVKLATPDEIILVSRKARRVTKFPSRQ
jgi:hypothetical protein